MWILWKITEYIFSQKSNVQPAAFERKLQVWFDKLQLSSYIFVSSISLKLLHHRFVMFKNIVTLAYLQLQLCVFRKTRFYNWNVLGAFLKLSEKLLFTMPVKKLLPIIWNSKAYFVTCFLNKHFMTVVWLGSKYAAETFQNILRLFLMKL